MSLTSALWLLSPALWKISLLIAILILFGFWITGPYNGPLRKV